MGLGELITLLIIGALAGTAAASLLGRRGRKKGDLVRNTAIGVVGAFVGGVVFRALDINMPSALEEAISLADVIVAFVGAVIVILVVEMINR